MTIFEFVVTKEHIEIQKNASRYQGANLFRGSCELPEYHQCEVDDNQVIYKPKPGEDYRVVDTIHSVIGECDYKIDAKPGVFLSESTKKSINNGITKAIVIWSWVKGPNSHSSAIQIGEKLSYEIKGWIDAKEALALLDKTTNRFKYKKLNVL